MAEVLECLRIAFHSLSQPRHFVKILYVLLLKFFIGIKTLFASESKPEETKAPGKIFVLAADAAFKSTETGLQKAFTQTKRIENITEAATGGAVLFCEPSISFNEIISLMQQYKNQYQFYIHAAETKSIVGSADKNQPGVPIEL